MPSLRCGTQLLCISLLVAYGQRSTKIGAHESFIIKVYLISEADSLLKLIEEFQKFMMKMLVYRPCLVLWVLDNISVIKPPQLILLPCKFLIVTLILEQILTLLYFHNTFYIFSCWFLVQYCCNSFCLKLQLYLILCQ